MDEKPAPCRVLIAEDDPEVRSSLALAMIDEGYAVSTARNGDVALDHAEDKPPDVILLDLSMPDMDGAEFRRWQLADPQLRQVPVIVLSGAADAAQRANALGAAAWLGKPFDLDELLDLIARVLPEDLPCAD